MLNEQISACDFQQSVQDFRESTTLLRARCPGNGGDYAELRSRSTGFPTSANMRDLGAPERSLAETVSFESQTRPVRSFFDSAKSRIQLR